MRYLYIVACTLSLLGLFFSAHEFSAVATLINASLGLYINFKSPR